MAHNSPGQPTQLSMEEGTYMFNHVFLPPNLPQEDDYNVGAEEALLKAVIQSLETFKSHVRESQISMIDSAIATMRHLHHTQDFSGDASQINQEKLLDALELLGREDGTIPLHIRAQNCGMIFQRSSSTIIVNMFELSPLNNAVISTTGRLRRIFPGSAISIPLTTFQSHEFQETVAYTLARMSFQPAHGTKPQVKKNGVMLDEDRDTTHPKMITQLFSSFLLSVGSPVDITSIWKNTREEVFWRDAKLPFHRSALWLLIRVTLQLHFAKTEIFNGCSEQTYKLYMLFFMTGILERGFRMRLRSCVCSAMSAKISRRYQKLIKDVPQSITAVVESALSSANATLQRRWSQIQEKDGLPNDFESLRDLDFEQDTYFYLSELGGFIDSISNRGKNYNPPPFLGNCPLDSCNASTIPVVAITPDRVCTMYRLASFESWVASDLQEWLIAKEEHPGTCGVLGKLIQDYHKAALGYYEGNPELMSIMILTILELWVASDKSAMRNCILLGEYDPEIPMGLLESLNLSTRGQMERLRDVEDYLTGRSSSARFPLFEVLHRFGGRNCFSVRYFNQSTKHQWLLAKIESRAERERDAKREEFRQKRDQYQSLMRRFDQTEHTTIVGDTPDGESQEHDDDKCPKCALQKKANDLDIEIHEWPLPSDELRAKSVVFELRVPHSFGHWRDTTVFVLSDVLESTYLKKENPFAHYELAGYLSNDFQGFDPEQRIILLSGIKPQLRTHRRMKGIITNTEDSVCLKNALRLQYYDRRRHCFVSPFEATQSVPKLCTYHLTEQSAGEVPSMQQFLYRSMTEPSGLPPNKVLATQSACPTHISIEEYKALTTLPLGYIIQWQNILVQLEMPSVDFRKEETAFFILQSIFQVGPCNSEDVLRDSHRILDDMDFAQALLDGLYRAVRRVEKNWQSFQALGIFVSIARRLLSLAQLDYIKKNALDLLNFVRNIALGWIKTLEDQFQSATDDDVRADLRLKVTKVALICVDTFNVDDGHLRAILASTDHACNMIRCSIVIQEGLRSIQKTVGPLTSIMHRRWERLAFRGFTILAKEIIYKKSPALDNAIKESWSAFHPDGGWQALPKPHHHWVKGRSVLESGGEHEPLIIHFSLLTGELLVNGTPLTRLPRAYEEHPMYSNLFGKSILEVVPSPVPGMRFASKKAFNEHDLNFGTEMPGGVLFLRAMNEGRTFELVPRRVLRDSFPTMFVDNFVHWYNETDGYLEFCPQELPWAHSEQNWRLIRSGALGFTWQLAKGNSFLINNQSRTATGMLKILAPLEEEKWMNIILHSSSLDIELPRLKLGFCLKRGESVISSRQFRNMLVDENQSIGTLVGLRRKLVLKGANDRVRRKVIIPTGKIEFTPAGRHVNVYITTCPNTKVHIYEVDNLLGRLIDNSSLQSRLLISYLHALTSFPLPDPLTGKTGTEQALAILKSAAVRSFKWLTPEDIGILMNIASLTPYRAHYPAKQQEMQTVGWLSKLDFLAQHGEFYTTVHSIFNQAEKSKFFYPESYVEQPSLHHVQQSLLYRDLIRSSTFRVSGFGAEYHTPNHDVVYKSRDREQYSPQASLAFALSSTIFKERFRLQRHLESDVGDFIWKFLSRTIRSAVNGSGDKYPISSLNYDSGLLINSAVFIARNWIRFQQLLSDTSIKTKRFQVMMWLATLSFAEDANIDILQIMASFFVVPEMNSITAPSGHSFTLSIGSHIDLSQLRSVLSDTCLPMSQSPEAKLPSHPGESEMVYNRRCSQIFRDNQHEALTALLNSLIRQWPCSEPIFSLNRTSIEWYRYIDMNDVMMRTREFFEPRFCNHELVGYLRRISNLIPRGASLVKIPEHAHNIPPRTPPRKPGFITNGDIFSYGAPIVLPSPGDDMTQILTLIDNECTRTLRLPSLLERLTTEARSGYEESYVEDLSNSVQSLQGWKREYGLTVGIEEIEELLTRHRDDCQKVVDEIQDAILGAVGASPQATQLHWPRLCPTFFLRGLSRGHWQKLSDGWKDCLVHYGIAISNLQRATRALRVIHNPSILTNELRNAGHTWEVRNQPESLLLEIESDIMIRPVQEQIAMNMISPETGKNAVMQLNMGEGKSSVIVPMVATALADGQRLVRVVVAKPQSKQMSQMLISKLGGLLDRQVYHMPFSRAVKVGHEEVGAMKSMLEECRKNGGIFLTQPEHILSFKLMGIECTLTGREEIGRALVQIQGSLNACTRDIVDESDENFSVKFELVYTMGIQRPTEHSPERWVCIHQVLDIIRQLVLDVSPTLSSSIEVHSQFPGCFPRTRILQPDAADVMLSQVVEQVCTTGLTDFPIARQPEHVREAVRRYITEVEPEETDIALVEDQVGISQNLLLLRGLIAGGILTFAFGHKRWRVDYGLAPSRQPATKLAVPYRAKDNPSPRSEFSHPDVVIILTSLSYYYSGLDDEDLFQAFFQLLNSDQADLEYQVWVKDAMNLLPAYRQLVGVNLEDSQCTQHVFEHLRYAKSVIDYFLAHVVFPKEMKEFPHKLSASGWDIGEIKTHPTTGFSGTNDSRQVLPLDVEQLDLESQKHTNALVLENLLQPENSVELMPPRQQVDGTIAEMLLNIITNMDPPTRVILDVGAQILELDNIGVARTWLDRTSDNPQIHAAIFFDDNDEIFVLDRKGYSEPLQTSPFASQLDVCLVFLDEAHTRGTDLKLPKDYRAAVTLGANLTKDRLVQACMRMRMLGAGQSVVFCVPAEIQRKIQTLRFDAGLSADPEISVLDILAWTIGETWQDIHRSMALWASQGRRYEKHKGIWVKAGSDGEIKFSKDLAENYLEDEARTLERRYRPHIREETNLSGEQMDIDITDPISLRCNEFKDLKLDSAALQEEEERELSPEVQQEKEEHRPLPAEPAIHRVHNDVKAFIRSGTIAAGARGYKPAFSAVHGTTATALFDVSQFRPGLLVSIDFIRTIKRRDTHDKMDSYQRSIQWILAAGPPAAIERMMVISPYEAQELLPLVEESEVVALHLYAPRSNLGYRRLDTLDLYTVPISLSMRQAPQRLVTELNLFAGQLYFDSFEQYVDACKFLGISWDTPREGEEIAADGFILRDSAGRVGGESGLKSSPVAFFKLLHTKIRRNCESIDKTHMGKLLDNQLLKPSDFEN